MIIASQFRILSLWLSLSAATAILADGRYTLPQNVAVPRQTVSLADLLPASVAPAIRHLAERVALGAAPPPGTIREISRAEILLACRAAAVPCAGIFDLPEFLLVHRAHLVLPPAGPPDTPPPSLEPALSISNSPNLFPDAAEIARDPSAFRVLSVRQDPLLHRDILRVTRSGRDSAVPFDVVLPNRNSSHAQTSFSAAHPAFEPQSAIPALASRQPSSAKPALVDPKRSASLTLRSPQSQVQLRVRPLEPGNEGDNIRVRVTATGKTLRATVIAADTLQAPLY